MNKYLGPKLVAEIKIHTLTRAVKALSNTLYVQPNHVTKDNSKTFDFMDDETFARIYDLNVIFFLKVCLCRNVFTASFKSLVIYFCIFIFITVN